VKGGAIRKKGTEKLLPNEGPEDFREGFESVPNLGEGGENS